MTLDTIEMMMYWRDSHLSDQKLLRFVEKQDRFGSDAMRSKTALCSKNISSPNYCENDQ